MIQSNAVIVEASCENARTISGEQNLAQFMKEMAAESGTQRTVIASKGRSNADLDEVTSWVPFSIRFYEESFGDIEEMTYSSK